MAGVDEVVGVAEVPPLGPEPDAPAVDPVPEEVALPAPDPGVAPDAVPVVVVAPEPVLVPAEPAPEPELADPAPDPLAAPGAAPEDGVVEVAADPPFWSRPLAPAGAVTSGMWCGTTSDTEAPPPQAPSVVPSASTPSKATSAGRRLIPAPLNLRPAAPSGARSGGSR